MNLPTKKQECIPVGCVPPAAVAGWVSTSVHGGIPPGCGPEDPQARPLIFVLGCAPGDPPDVGLECQVWAWRHPQRPDP